GLKNEKEMYGHPSDTYVFTMKMEILLEPASNKLLAGDSLNLPDHRYTRRCCSPIPAKSDSSPHAHTQALEVNHSALRLLILNFLKDLQSQIKNRILGRVLAL
ncbi:hypothetical protein Tco_1564618, partial [Tanacetum coccineum]